MTQEIRRISKELIEYHGEVLQIPRHIAVIPDGNRRWAKEHGLPAVSGHKKGVDAYRQLLSDAAEFGIRYVTFYAFSTENWKRSAAEVDGLMSLLAAQLKNFNKIMGKNKDKIRFLIIGDRSRLSASLQKSIARIEEETLHNTELTALIAINYGGRDEITRAVRHMMMDCQDGELVPENVTEQTVASYLDTAGIPDPDLLIRTSGEIRLSNYLLWQLAYSEIYITDCLWPDFNRDELIKAIEQFNQRDRRFGGVKA